MRFKHIALFISATAALTACGETTGAQALLGGASGAVGAAANILYCENNPGSC